MSIKVFFSGMSVGDVADLLEFLKTKDYVYVVKYVDGSCRDVLCQSV